MMYKMGNSPRRYAYLIEKTPEASSLAKHLGFPLQKKLKIRKGDTVLIVGSFPPSNILFLPSCTIFIIDPSAGPSVILSLSREIKPKYLRLRSKYPNFITLLNSFLSSYDIEGNTWERVLPLLDYFIQQESYNHGYGFTPSFSLDKNKNVLEETV